MVLAPLLRKLQHAAVPGSTIATLDDPALAARVRAAAYRQGVEPDAFLVAAVSSFEDQASNEEVGALLVAAIQYPAPGTFSFKRIIERALDCELRAGEAIPPRAVA